MGGIHNDKVAIFFAALRMTRMPYPSLRFPLNGMYHTMTRMHYILRFAQDDKVAFVE
jgi:hypothetical protein